MGVITDILKLHHSLMNKIATIIDYSDLNEAIWDCTDKEWTLDDTCGQLFIDRGDNEGLYGYSAQQISSLGTLGEKYYCGEYDGCFIALAHDEDSDWDDTLIIILSLSNKVTYNDDRE